MGIVSAATAKADAIFRDANALQNAANAVKAKAVGIHRTIHKSKCENNPACVTAGLKGYCCPTLVGTSFTGVTLGCCGSASDDLNMLEVPDVNASVELDAPIPRQCSAFQECGGLQGNCCPNNEGTMLSCCILGTVSKRVEAAQAKADAAKAVAEKKAASAMAAKKAAHAKEDHADKLA